MKYTDLHSLIEVVNVKTQKSVNLSYVGRYNSYFGKSILGNPFKVGIDGSREKVIEKYKTWLDEQYNCNQLIRQTILKLVEKVKKGEKVILGCWCTPKACHADVIKQKIIKIALTE